MGARFFRPSADTFTSRDTFDGMLGTPVSLNRYTYANGDPIQNWDPDGHAAKQKKPSRAQFAQFGRFLMALKTQEDNRIRGALIAEANINSAGNNALKARQDAEREERSRKQAAENAANAANKDNFDITKFVSGVVAGVVDGLKDVWNAIKTFAGWIYDAAKCVFGSCSDLNKRIDDLKKSIIDTASAFWNTAVDTIKTGNFGGLFKTVVELGTGVSIDTVQTCIKESGAAYCTGKEIGKWAIGVVIGIGGAKIVTTIQTKLATVTSVLRTATSAAEEVTGQIKRLSGREIKIGPNLRIAPFGNRTGNPTGRFPHYHRRSIDSVTGETIPGQGIGRHRPWDTRSTDTRFRDRF